MDYQTSTSRFSEIGLFYRRTLVFLLSTLSGVGMVLAYTTTNPLSVDISITALVPLTATNNPDQHPDTLPIPPVPVGPVNMIDTSDVAVFRGLAYPGSVVSLLKNGVIVAESPSATDGRFEIRLRSLSPGTYTFGLRAEDTERLKSKLLTVTVYVSQGVTTLVEGIFIPPTITTDKLEVKYGDIVDIFGRSSPNAEVRVSINKKTELVKSTIADSQGLWLYRLDTKEVGYGGYEAKAMSVTEENISPYGDIVTFIVSDVNRVRLNRTALSGFRKKCDLNEDNRVNILDFSIMAFWYKRLGFPGKVDLSSDGRINLTDLSILAYCWTG